MIIGVKKRRDLEWGVLVFPKPNSDKGVGMNFGFRRGPTENLSGSTFTRN